MVTHLSTQRLITANLGVVRELQNYSAIVVSASNNGWTHLKLATSYVHIEVFQELRKYVAKF